MEIQKVNKNIYNVLASGSTGNCEIAFGCIAVDMGIPFSKIEPHLNTLQLVLVSHKHLDHFNINTIKRIVFERPSIRFGIGQHMVKYFEGIKNVDVYEMNRWHNYGNFKIAIGKLYHDTENNFYRIEKNGYKIFRATDTSHLDKISAKNYDLYAIEHNYDEDTIDEAIERHPHKASAINTHLSEQQAREWIYNNRKESSEVVRLHESKSN